MPYSLAVDIGGTFTDIVLRGSGRLVVDKTLTTHHDLLEGFFLGVHSVLRKAGIGPADIDGVVVHATTVVTNALIERKGPETALIVTEGFRDVLSIRNEHRYEMFDPQIEFPEPLIPRALTFGIAERTLADGEVLLKADRTAIEALAAELVRQGVVSVAVCLLNSYRNPANEQIVGEALEAAAPGLYVTLSSAVAPQIREYPRASTAAVNAYTMPITEPYLRGLAMRLRDEGIPNHPLIMLSSGGVIGAAIAGRNPVRMIESGPAAGALAASYFAERLGLDRLLSFDMGGTTAKACLIEDRKPLVTGHFEVDRVYRFCEGSGMPLTIPSIDMIEIGAGGGSIAHVDALGLLKVGPHSAGSAPGPACYGRGGMGATVTDADLVLGLLDAEHFLGGDMKLDLAAARAAIGRLGEQLGTDIAQTAGGVYRIVAETMASAARTHATDRGVDHRGLPLLAFGGAGAGACLRRRCAAAKHIRHLPAAGQRSVGLRHAGDARPHRPGPQRTRPPGRSRLDPGGCRSDGDDGRGRPRARRSRRVAGEPRLRRRPPVFRPAERGHDHLPCRSKDNARRRRHHPHLRSRLPRAIRRPALPRARRDRQLAPDGNGPRDHRRTNGEAIVRHRRRKGHAPHLALAAGPSRPRPRTRRPCRRTAPGRPGDHRGARDDDRPAAWLDGRGERHRLHRRDARCLKKGRPSFL